MSDTQLSTPTTEPTPTPPVVTNDDLRLLLNVETEKRKQAEDKASKLEAQLAEAIAKASEVEAILKAELRKAQAEAKQAQAEAKAASDAVQNIEKTMKDSINEAYLTYLSVWPDARTGKLTADKKIKSTPPEAFALAQAAYDASAPKIRTRKEFDAELHKALGV